MQEEIQNIKNQAISEVLNATTLEDLEEIRINYFGRNGKFTTLIKSIKKFSPEERKKLGILINESKSIITSEIERKKFEFQVSAHVWFDPTIPGKKIKIGSTHAITKAIREIEDIFTSIGFIRVRYPEVEWDWYSFGALNFPKDHPARDNWETFFIDEKEHPKYGKMLLTPHTSSGQIREMENNKPPIRMINISKCYRRQIDASHYPMFFQFEGLVVDKDINITHLKGTLDFFVRSFYGKGFKSRIRPHHFMFTEPSFEVDMTCGFCEGHGCSLCKSGWVELGGAGMVHPQVLKNCNIDPKIYSGFAFGWGVERVYMMKKGIGIGDLRHLYSQNIEILKQF